jgi:hypothetical protein
VILRLPDVKALRARLIRRRLPRHYRALVCFSCGNATRALREEFQDLTVIGIDGRSKLRARGELTFAEIAATFGPDAFNATSGYLPLEWMAELGRELAALLPPAARYFVPCGSGETVFALSFAIPSRQLVAVTADYDPIRLFGPLARWVETNLVLIRVGPAKSVADALQQALGGHEGVGIEWEHRKGGPPRG